jgi:hypothetical protein
VGVVSLLVSNVLFFILWITARIHPRERLALSQAQPSPEWLRLRFLSWAFP